MTPTPYDVIELLPRNIIILVRTKAYERCCKTNPLKLADQELTELFCCY